MLSHEYRLLADDSHEIPCLIIIFFFCCLFIVYCCSRSVFGPYFVTRVFLVLQSSAKKGRAVCFACDCECSEALLTVP